MSGSIATVAGCQRGVRFSPDSDQIAGAPTVRSGQRPPESPKGTNAPESPMGPADPKRPLVDQARFTVFLKLNARFSLPMSFIALNSRYGKDNRLSRHRHHCCVCIRLLAIGTEGEQMTVPNARR